MYDSSTVRAAGKTFSETFSRTFSGTFSWNTFERVRADSVNWVSVAESKKIADGFEQTELWII